MNSWESLKIAVLSDVTSYILIITVVPFVIWLFRNPIKKFFMAPIYKFEKLDQRNKELVQAFFTQFEILEVLTIEMIKISKMMHADTISISKKGSKEFKNFTQDDIVKELKELQNILKFITAMKDTHLTRKEYEKLYEIVKKMKN